MMTLEEAIKHCEEVADADCYGDKQYRCSEEHRQLAEWLRELKEVYSMIDGCSDTDALYVGYIRKRMKGNIC